MQHASIQLGEYNIPLIGIPKSATEYECDCCHKIFSDIKDVQINIGGFEFYCKTCRQNFWQRSINW